MKREEGEKLVAKRTEDAQAEKSIAEIGTRIYGKTHQYQQRIFGKYNEALKVKKASQYFVLGCREKQ